MVTKDNQRFFTNVQRQVIFREAFNPKTRQYECQADTSKEWYEKSSCSKTIDESSYEADHIDPWSNGGETRISNGKALCPSCNSRKHANL